MVDCRKPIGPELAAEESGQSAKIPSDQLGGGIPPGDNDLDQKLQFLYKAHEDSQNLIRFLDAKAAFAIAILAAMTNKVLSSLGDYFPWGPQPYWRQFIILGFGFSALLATFLLGVILFPITNPALNTRLVPDSGPIFFLTQLSPKRLLRYFSRSPRFSRLAQDQAEYLGQITAANGAILLRIISGEVLKVSYIRQIKTERFRAMTIMLTACAVFFLVLMGTDAVRPRPSKPTSVQIQGPVTLNSAPASALPPAPPPGSATNSPAPHKQGGATRP
jgi:hypothetical protein